MLGADPMLEPDTRSAAVFIDKFYAGVLQGALDLPHVLSNTPNVTVA
jgi:hypothetical protein